MRNPGRAVRGMGVPRSCVAALLMLVATVLLVACGDNLVDAETDAETAELKVEFEDPAGRANKIGAELLEAGETELVAATLAEAFELPDKLSVRVTNDPQGPYYDPNADEVVLDYDFALTTFEVLAQNNPGWGDRRLVEAASATSSFVLAHEFAHALIDIYDLPVLGREEDAADNIASVILLNTEDGWELALDAAEFWAGLEEYRGAPELADYADEHSLDMQRAFSIICKIAGSDRQLRREVRQLGLLPPERLARCPEEYEGDVKSLEQVLEPHLREPLDLP
jgi:hypothetical protein